MKTVRIFCGITLMLLLAWSECNAQTTTQYPYYVVVGAFAKESNAISFVKKITKEFPGVQRKIHSSRKLHYVFVAVTSDKKAAFAQAMELQKREIFHDAWVYNGPLGDEVVVPGSEGVDTNPAGEKLAGVSTSDKITVTQSEPEPEPIVVPEEKAPEPEKKPETPIVEEKPLNPGEKKAYFKVYRESNGAIVDGNIVVIDVDKSRQLYTVEGNSDVILKSPNNSSGRVIFVCDVFGYRQAQEAVDYNQFTDIKVDSTGRYIIPIGLVRLQKGDLAVMYRVLFFIDAAIMKPESELDLKSLLEMMKENPDYKIRVHGHTNGGKGGKILYPGESHNFFSLNGAKEGAGSAQKLSQRRAEAVRDYLIVNGINKDRIEIKAWGGRLPLYDKRGPQAQQNVRVEVEILK